jgi:cytochrome c oxidase cbb3-type subunit 3
VRNATILTVAVAMSSWAQTVPAGPPTAAKAAEERGRAQFAQSCGFCHGPNANGGTHGPSLIRSAVVRHDENGNLISAVIRDGRPEQGMPAVPLAPEQVADIVTFVKSRVVAADIRSANRSILSSEDKLLTGNPAAGKAFFEGTGGCVACHSTTGDLAGIARKYPAAVLQTRFLYPQIKRIAATVTDSGGKRYSGTLVALTNYDVSLIDADGWYHSWPLVAVTADVKDQLAVHRALLGKYTDSDMHNILAYLEGLR